jgi:hypothetical protein
LAGVISLYNGTGAGTADLAPHVHAIGGQEHEAECGLEGECHQAQSDLDHEQDEEPELVVGELAGIDLELAVRSTETVAVDEQGRADHRVGNRGEDQRTAECRTHTDVPLGGGRAEDHGDEGHGRLGQGGAEGGQHGTGRGRAQAHLAADPLDPVDEVLAGEIDRRGG